MAARSARAESAAATLARLPAHAAENVRRLVLDGCGDVALINVAALILDLALMQADGEDAAGLVDAAAHPAVVGQPAAPQAAAVQPVAGVKRPRGDGAGGGDAVGEFCAAHGLDAKVEAELRAAEPRVAEETMLRTTIGPNCRNPSAIVMTTLRSVTRDEAPPLAALPAGAEPIVTAATMAAAYRQPLTIKPPPPLRAVHPSNPLNHQMPAYIPVAPPHGVVPVAPAHTVAAPPPLRGRGAPTMHPVAPAIADAIMQFATRYGLDSRTTETMRELPADGLDYMLTTDMIGPNCRNPNAVVMSNMKKWRAQNGM